MNTLGSTTNTKVTREESYALAIGFTANGALVKGQMVKLEAAGTVAPIAAATDHPIGMVTKGGADGEEVTVLTNFIAILKGTADGAVDLANPVSVSGFNSTDERDNWADSTTSDFVMGIALSDALDEAELEVGVIRYPYISA